MSKNPTDQVVDRRYDFVLLFDVTDGNPNGDPDAGNLPRIDPQTLQGLVTDVCIKRKIRNAVAALAGDKPGYNIYFQTQDAVYEKRVLNLLHQSAYEALGLTKSTEKKEGKTKAESVAKARAWMCGNFFDVRTFGAVMATGDFNCGQVRGPAQLTFARSLDPIVPLEIAITRKSVTTEKDAEAQVQKDGAITGTMGRKNTLPYALYRASGFISPGLAKDTGFTYADLALLFRALQQMFDIDRSASRGLMATRGLHVFQHRSALGEAPAHALFDRVLTPSLGQDAAPRSYEHYRPGIQIKTDGLPQGVSYRDLTTTPIEPSTFPWAD